MVGAGGYLIQENRYLDQIKVTSECFSEVRITLLLRYLRRS